MNTLFVPAPFWLIIAAVAIELLWAWPSDVAHPVRLIGWLLDRLEGLARKSADLRLTGVLCLLASMMLIGGIVASLLAAPWLGWAFGICLAVSGLALGELLRVCSAALKTLENGEVSGCLEQARQEIGHLVSRDTSAMEPAELRRALAETLAENFNDAFVAPLFWLLLGGPVGLWLYKTVSTMDSMWGYLTPHWKDLGMAGARLDDILAWLPARLSAILLRLTAVNKDAWPGWSVIRAQAGLMASPNAGWPMAAAAWLHNARMGGPTPYFGAMQDKPRLGPWCAGDDKKENADWDSVRLSALLHHIRRAGLLGSGLAALAAWLM